MMVQNVSVMAAIMRPVLRHPASSIFGTGSTFVSQLSKFHKKIGIYVFTFDIKIN